MVLSGRSIEKLINEGVIEISPFDKELQLQTTSVDIRLSNRYYRYPVDIEPELEMLDPKNPYMSILEKDYISEKGTVIKPKSFIISESLEYIKVSENISISIQPKFRISRLGIQILNQGLIEQGFEGNIELCLYNAGDMPVRIFPDMAICHIFFLKVE